jgi:hypothetical protein
VSRLISRPPAEQTSGATSAADKARRPASLAVDQIRICHQPANGESAWHRGVNPTGVGIDDRVQISAGCSALSCSTSVGKIIIPQLQGGLAETGIRATVPPPDRSRQYPPGANCEPWQGQSQHCSSEFQWTTQAIRVQLAERACRCPCSSRQTAIFFSLLRNNPPSPGLSLR